MAHAFIAVMYTPVALWIKAFHVESVHDSMKEYASFGRDLGQIWRRVAWRDITRIQGCPPQCHSPFEIRPSEDVVSSRGLAMGDSLTLLNLAIQELSEEN